MNLSNKPQKPTNRPGISQIAYRIGDYNTFRERLLSGLAHYLPELTTRDPQDFAIALVDSWAVVADVLSFYQERIANEGYLLTATERRSVLELARAIGYELKPGVAASTYLAFIVEDTPDGPRKVTVPKLAQVMSVPSEDESPQIFESSKEIVARVDWNRLTPRQGRPQQITNNTQQLYLEGIATQLEPGDSILLLDREDLEVAKYLLTLTDVVAVPEAGHTIVSWQQPLPLDAPLRQPQVFAFRQQAALFGNLAPDWLADVPDEIKRTAKATFKGGVFQTIDQGDRWLPLNTGLPNADILCLVVNQRHDFLVGTPGWGIFRSRDRGVTWTQIIAGLTNLTVSTLYVDWEQEYILAGTPGGGVFRSTDNGENWSSIGDGTIRVETSGEDDNKSVATVNTGLPDTLVHSLVTCSTPIKQDIGTISKSTGTKLKVPNVTTLTTTAKLRVGDIIATADGQVRTVTNIDTANSDTFLIVDSVFRPNLPNGTAFSIGGTYIFAGTEEGVYRTQDRGKNWYLKGLSNRVIRALLVSYRAINQTIHGTGTITSSGTTVIGTDTEFRTELQKGDKIIASDEIKTVVEIDPNDEQLTIDTAFTDDLTSATFWILPVGRTHVFAGTDNGIFRSSDYGETWNEVHQGLINKNVTSLATDFRVGMGTISTEHNTVTGIGTTFSDEIKPGDTIVAGGQTRFVEDVDGLNILTVDTAFAPDLPVGTTFAIANRTALFAGTVDGGIFRSGNNGNTWSSVNTDLTNLKITSLVVDAFLGTGTITSNGNQINGNGTLFAQELRVGDSITAWGGTKIVTEIDADNPNTVLFVNEAFDSNPLPAETNFTINNLFAGTVDGGVFRSVDDGEHWSEINGDVAAISPTRGLATPEITALAIHRLRGSVIANKDNLLAGTRFSGFVEQEWPGFQLTSPKIDLDTLYTGILENSWLVLLNGDRFEALQVDRVGDGSRRDFLLDTTITSIIPTAPITTSSNFNLRTTNVLLQSEQLAMAQESLSISSQQANIFGDPISIADKSIFLSQFVQGLESGQALIIAGKRPRAKVKLGGMASSQNWNILTEAELGEGKIQALKIIPEGYLVVGTDKGVDIFFSDDKGISWKSISKELPSHNVTSFVTSREEGIGHIIGNGTQILGQTDTKFLSQLQTGDLIVVDGQTKAVTSIKSDTELSIDNAFSVNINGTQDFTINKLFAGTDQGIFRFHFDNQQWEQVNQQELQNVQTLAIKQVDNVNNPVQLFAGTKASGVWRSDDYGRNWNKINYGLTNHNIRSLLVNPDNGQIFAGTASNGIFRSVDSGQNWQQIAYTKPGTGTITSNGTEVLGNRTALGREVKSGDLITVAGQTRVVTELDSITPDLKLTINTAFNSDLPARTNFDISTGLTDMKISHLEIYRQPETIRISSNGITVTGEETVTGTSFLDSLSAGDIIIANNEIRTVNQIISDTQLTIDRPFSNSLEQTAFLTPPRSKGIVSSDRNLIRGKGTNFTSELRAGDAIIAAGQIKIVEAVLSATEIAVNSFFEQDLSEGTLYFVPCRGQGTISSIDTTVAGDENAIFTTELQKNDVIVAAGEIRTVNGFNLTIDAEFEEDLPLQTIFFILPKAKGTIQSEGTTVTGDQNTAFATQLEVGDIIIAANQIRTVAAVDSQTGSLTIDAEFEENLPLQTIFFIPPKAKGTIQSEGTTVTGDQNTAFTTQLEVGDIIIAANQIKTVVAFNLLIDTAFNEENLSNTPFSFFSRTILLTSTTNDGIFRSDNNGGRWSAINTGLTDLEIRSLAVHPSKGYFFAGTANSRLFRSTNLGNSWSSIDAGLSFQSVEAIAIANDNQQVPIDILFTGAGNKIFRSRDYGRNWQDLHWQRINQDLTAMTVQAIAIHREQSRRYLFAGTREGVFSSSDGGQHWQPLNDGLTNLNVQALLGFSSSFQLFAGTKDGLFRSTDYGRHWNPVDIRIPQAEIRALASDLTHQMLFIATFADGVIRYAPESDRSIPLGLTDAFLQAMTINPANGDIYIGTNSRGIFYSSNQGNSWQQLIKTRSGTGTITSDGINVTGENTKFNRELRVGDEISVAGQKRTVVTISPDNPNTSITIDRPLRRDLRSSTSFTIHTGLTNLNVTALAVYSLPGTGAITIEGVKVTGTGTEFNQELKVGDTITVANQTGTVIEITSNKEELFVEPQFTQDITEATPFTRDIIFAGTAGSGIFCSTNQGQLWSEVNTGLDNHLEIRCLGIDKYGKRILAGTALGGVFASTELTKTLNLRWQPLNTGLTNTDIRAIAVDPNHLFVGGMGILLSEDGFYSVEVQPSDWLYLMHPPSTASPGQKWRVKNLDNFVGTITTVKDEDLTLYPAREEDQTISELGMINLPPNDQQLPRITLEKPLQNSYDPATVSLYGNIVEATHGETVNDEILGSGDGTVANQRFELQKPPLTFTSAPTSSGAVSTLKVSVNDVEWQPANSLYPLDKTAQAYIIRLEDDGTTKVIFGDGERGARLPSGQENIVAQYRSGIGIAGNISADSLTILKTRPLGIEEVTNPLAASGGAERENLAQARTNAPLTIRTLDRIVSLRDFEDFARTFAGISKAQAVPLWIADRQLVHITVAATQGKQVEPDSILYQNLLDAIDTARDPVQQVQVDSYEQVIFDLDAKVLTNPRYQTDRVMDNIRLALKQTFSFERSEFGQVISTSEIIATIQKIEGVTAVDLNLLYRRGSSKILNQSLIAQKASWDSETNAVTPAQLLFLAPDSITLSQSSTSLEV